MYLIRDMEDSRRIFPCRIPESYEISLMRKDEEGCPERRKELVKMLMENFLQDETLVQSLRIGANLTKESDKLDYRADEHLLMKTVVDEGLDKGRVILVKHKESGRISGAAVLLVHERFDGVEKPKGAPNCCEDRLRSTVIKEFFRYMEEIERAGNVFDIYPNCEVWVETNIIAIDKLDRRNGLALDLYKAAFETAKEIPRATVFAARCTSVYSQKIARKIGQKSVSVFDVTKLNDPREGKPVFQDTRPNNLVALMASEI